MQIWLHAPYHEVMKTLAILLVLTSVVVATCGCQQRPILVGPLSEGGTMPLGMWVDEVRQPGFEELKRGETEHAYWAVFGNPLGFVHVAFEARTPTAAGESAETRLVFLHGDGEVDDLFERERSNWGRIDRLPVRPWKEEPGVVSMIPVGGIERVASDYEGEIRVVAVVDGYKTLVDTVVWWPPGSLPVALSPVPLGSP